MKPALQERHHDYVLGPNQDERLSSIAAGELIKGVTLGLDSDAPFQLRSRAVRCAYDSSLQLAGLQNLRMRWAGPGLDYRQQGLVPVTVEMPYFGLAGNPRSVFPPVVYPANGVIMVDVENTGATTITDLRLYVRGVKLFPWGSVPGYTYPARMGSNWGSYVQEIADLGLTELRQDVVFTVKADADFVIRGGLATAPFLSDGNVVAEVAIRLKDFNKKPYSNDFIPFDVMFGAAGFPSAFPLGSTPDYIAPFGPGPMLPGLFYPELYVPANHQLLFDLQRSDSAGSAEDFSITWLGAKVYPK